MRLKHGLYYKLCNERQVIDSYNAKKKKIDEVNRTSSSRFLFLTSYCAEVEQLKIRLKKKFCRFYWKIQSI